MIITQANMASLFVALSAAFATGMETPAPVDFVQLGLVNDFPSVTSKNAYPFEEAPEGFKEWDGDRVWKDFVAHMHEVKNRPFEYSRKVKRDVIDDDLHGIFAPLLTQKGTEWPVLLYELVVEVLTNQHKAFDGKTFFNATHTKGYNGTLANLVTDALTKTVFEAALNTAAAWKFSNGKLVRPKFTHLLHGPGLAGTVFELVQSEYVVKAEATGDATTTYVGAGIRNRHYNRVTAVEIPDFVGDYANYWVLLDCSKFLKPVFVQQRRKPVFRMTTDPQIIDETGEIKMGADGRAAAGCSYPHLAIGGMVSA
ncbi:MAG: Mu-like prophage major head subunit gpT family protein [Lentisphaeria bacterium]|nr:Mu-like prophage major head subunit gpT family protein [Lentisphaeria bacterium]